MVMSRPLRITKRHKKGREPFSRPKPKRLARETISIFFAMAKEDKINGRESK